MHQNSGEKNNNDIGNNGLKGGMGKGGRKWQWGSWTTHKRINFKRFGNTYHVYAMCNTAAAVQPNKRLKKGVG